MRAWNNYRRRIEAYFARYPDYFMNDERKIEYAEVTLSGQFFSSWERFSSSLDNPPGWADFIWFCHSEARNESRLRGRQLRNTRPRPRRTARFPRRAVRWPTRQGPTLG